MINRVPFVKDLATGGDASVGVAAVLIRNPFESAIFPEFSGYYSVGVHEGKSTTRVRPGSAESFGAIPPVDVSPTSPTRGLTQGFYVFRLFMVPRNMLSTIGLMNQEVDLKKAISETGGLGGTYLGGGAELGLRFLGNRSFQTQVFGSWSGIREGASAPNIVPDVIMISLSPALGFKGPHLAAQGGVQYIKFFGIQGK
jgi:hypothetical protein